MTDTTTASNKRDRDTEMVDERGEQSAGPYTSGDAVASDVLEDVASLVGDSRDTHGDAVTNHRHIASGWTWYLRGQGLLRDDESLTGSDVARLMELVKMSRAVTGEYDIDHDRDTAGYASIAAACAYMRDADIDVSELTVTDT